MGNNESRPLATPVSFALVAAVLFGASTPVAKILLTQIEPVLLAGLLYGSSGVGLIFWWGASSRFRARRAQEASVRRTDLPWLAGATLAGGIVGPVLLMVGLSTTPASTAPLLLNLEGMFTALLAWAMFREHIGRRIALGMGAITAGGLVLSWAGRLASDVPWGAVAIVGACLAWGLDNNLTHRVSAGDPLQIAAAKGLIAGLANLTIALVADVRVPEVPTILMAAVVGFLGYGVSLVLFVLALRHLGTARTGTYFSLAPFMGAAISVFVLDDHVTMQFLAAAAMMGVGVWLHLTERHVHRHRHEPLTHEHRHTHDAHHQHGHSEGPHSHAHVHKELFHTHPHYPDIHHRHLH
jgi:drug/metabolite transporter (DMT)-like permease